MDHEAAKSLMVVVVREMGLAETLRLLSEVALSGGEEGEDRVRKQPTILSQEEYQEVLDLMREGNMSQKEVAARYRVSQSTVSLWCRKEGIEVVRHARSRTSLAGTPTE